MLGVDISRHQPSASINYAEWKRAGVRFIWVKGTDGGGLAPVETAARKVRDIKAAGIPVGLYGYAQLSPSPEIQADVLYDECVRLGAFGVMPALDLEDPHPATAASRPFAVRYLKRLKARGVDRPVLYANASMLRAIGADSVVEEVPGTLIWAANYGVNNGRRNPLSYKGRVDIHQYTSVGRLPGYSGNLDLNEAFTTLHLAGKKGDDMLKDETLRIYQEPEGWVSHTADVVVGNTHNYAKGAAATAARLEAKLDLQDDRFDEMELNVLTAVKDNGVKVDLTTEQMQALIDGQTEASLAAFRTLLGSLDEEPGA